MYVSAGPPDSRTAIAKRQRLWFTVVMFAICITVPYFVYRQLQSKLDKKGKEWFIYHPVLMSLGTIGIPLAAILQRRLFGYTSNKIHMHAMGAAVVSVFAGAYVIVTNKMKIGESHFETLHAKLGLIWVLVATVLASAGLTALDPDWRVPFFRPDRGIANVQRFIVVRRIHTWTGRVQVCLGYLVAYLGWIKFFGMAADTTRWLAMTSLLLGLTGVVLVDPINDYLAFHKGLARDELQQVRGG